MARPTQQQDTGAVISLLIAVMFGVIGVLATLMAFFPLVGAQATEAERLSRVASHVLWTQPFVYIMAGLLAGARDSRWGPVRAPVIGLFLASVAWALLRQRGLLPSEPNILAYLLPLGALFALLGAMVAPLLRDRISAVVGALWAAGGLAFILAFLNLGAISGPVNRELIQRAEGMTMRMDTLPVPDAGVELLDPESQEVLYVTHTGESGRYLINKVPIGDYTLRVTDPMTRAVLTSEVTVTRSITGGTPYQMVSLPAITQDAGRLFE